MYLNNWSEFIKEGKTEIEYICYNSDYDSISEVNQQKLYNELKELEKQSGYEIKPYMQDFSDDTHVEKSLAVIILSSNVDYWVKKLKNLGHKYSIEIDLVHDKPEHIVDEIISGKYNNII